MKTSWPRTSACFKDEESHSFQDVEDRIWSIPVHACFSP